MAQSEVTFAPSNIVNLIGVVVDRSGSMHQVKEAAVSGINEFLGCQNPVNNPELDDHLVVKVGMLLFNQDVEWTGDQETRFCDVKDFPMLTDSTYRPDGMTALYDAIKTMILSVDQYITDHPDQHVKPVIVIQTDGQENSSQECTRSQLLELITDRRQKGYEFIFLGANQDACMTARAIGIAEGSALSYTHDHDSTRGAMRTVSNGLSRVISGRSDNVEFTQTERDAVVQGSPSSTSSPGFDDAPPGRRNAGGGITRTNGGMFGAMFGLGS